MTLFEMKRIIESNDVVWEGWCPALLKLSPSRLQRPTVGSYPNILSTVEHAVGAELYWQVRMEKKPDSLDPGPLVRWQDIIERWYSLKARRLEWLSGADPQSKVGFKADDGSDSLVHAWECIVHMTSHSHFHRGQLVLLFRQSDLVPPSHHLIGYFMSVQSQ